MQDKFTAKDGFPNKYGFICGKIHTAEFDPNNYAQLFLEHPEIDVYTISGKKDGESFWVQFDSLSKAKRMFKDIRKMIISPFRKVKDIQALNELTGLV